MFALLWFRLMPIAPKRRLDAALGDEWLRVDSSHSKHGDQCCLTYEENPLVTDSRAAILHQLSSYLLDQLLITTLPRSMVSQP